MSGKDTLRQAIPPTIPGSNNLKTLEVENLSVEGKLFGINNPNNNDIIGYQESSQSWVPIPITPVIIQTTVGVIRNINNGVRWIRWGVNTDGAADSFVLPDNGSYVGFTISYNDISPINTGADPNSTWTIDVGLVYEGDESNIDCSNDASNFHPIDSYTFTKAEIDAGNGFPQITNRNATISLTGPSRISVRSTASGSWNFNNGDLIVNVYLAVNTINYQ